jgi:hypothetical protein
MRKLKPECLSTKGRDAYVLLSTSAKFRTSFESINVIPRPFLLLCSRFLASLTKALDELGHLLSEMK